MNDKKLNELSARFIIPLPHEISSQPELLFFKVEEAYWFYLDFFPKKKKLNLRTFAETLLCHNHLAFVEDEYRYFIKYKKHTPVYGALIVNQAFDKILLVNGYYNDQFFFPKGKINKHESPRACAVREVYEEVGYDVDAKIIGDEICIGKGFGLFTVINVSERICFRTRTRNEIKEIRWVPIEDIIAYGKGEFKQIGTCFDKCYEVIQGIKRNRFRLDVERIIKCVDRIGV